MKKCNIVLVKVDSDSEINWDEDEDLGDTDIPGVISAFDPVNLFSPKISYFVNNNKKVELITIFLLIVLLEKEDKSESLNCPLLAL